MNMKRSEFVLGALSVAFLKKSLVIYSQRRLHAGGSI